MDVEELSLAAQRLRYYSVLSTTTAGSGHPSTCLSMADFMAVLVYNKMIWGRDEFILSKGHAAPILWSVYAELGKINHKDLSTLRKNGSLLEGHPTPRMEGIRVATGSLGMGLANAIGIAYSGRRVYCVMGDGECAEGSVWESAAIASRLNLPITCIIDVNGQGQTGDTPLSAKMIASRFKAFGWNTVIVNGHNIKQLDKLRWDNGLTAIICKTIKGKGVKLIEGKHGWHGKTLSVEECADALDEIGCEDLIIEYSIDTTKAHKTKRTYKRPKVVDVSPREMFGLTLSNVNDSSLVAIDADVGNSTYLANYVKKYPKRSIQCYIAEQSMVGIASGLSSIGYTPVLSTFAAFFTRAYDQLRMAGVSKSDMLCVGTHAGCHIGADGASQMGLQDISMFRTIPSSVVLYPCDAYSTLVCTELLLKHKHVRYLRATRSKLPQIYSKKHTFKVGGYHVHCKGRNDMITILAAGVTLHEALAVAKQYPNVRVIDVYCVKPILEKIKNDVVGKTLVVEDHCPQGGIADSLPFTPDYHLAVHGVPISAQPRECLQNARIDRDAIEQIVQKVLKSEGVFR